MQQYAYCRYVTSQQAQDAAIIMVTSRMIDVVLMADCGSSRAALEKKIQPKIQTTANLEGKSAIEQSVAFLT